MKDLMRTSRLIALIAFLMAVLSAGVTAQTVTSFEGIDASQVPNAEYMVDASGAVGTKQFVEYTNVYFQAYDKITLAPLWTTPQGINSIWKSNGITSCNAVNNDGMIIFDRLAMRWVVGIHTSTANNYNYCVAVSSSDDLTVATWYTYVFAMDSFLGTNAEGQTYFPDWPKLATWSNGYYVGIDLNDTSQSFREVGILVCAFDRANMLINGTARTPICASQLSSPTGSIYLAHSLIPADVEGTTAPPLGRDEFFTSIENPTLGGGVVTSTTFNLWDFHADFSNPTDATLTQLTISESPYQPGCYTAGMPGSTICVPEPSTASTGQTIDSVGDRFMPGMSYRNFGSYESFLVSHTVQANSGKNQQTAIRWYELRDNGGGTPSIYQDGNINPDNTTYRFMPSIAEDASGNAAVGYNVSSSSLHPGMKAAYFSLTNPDAPTEITLYDGAGDEENTWHMGSYSSMTVDPEDGCTFWYVAQYFPTNQTGSPAWGSRINNFQAPGCGGPSLSPGSLTFANQGLGTTSPSQPITLINGGSTTLTISSITFTGTNSTDFGQNNNCSSVAPGDNCTINVTFTPGGLGTRTALLNVNDNGSNSPQTASLTGTGVAAVTLSSSSISFGSVYIGGSATAKPVTLTNNQSVPLTNINITIIGASAYSQVNTCGASIPANGQCTVTVTFTPTTTGAQTATVNIADNASNSPQTISLTGSGAVALSLSPTSLNFGTVTVGSTSGAKSITILNHEKAAVTFSNAQITGANSSNFSIVNNTCANLQSGATCTVSVTFSPSAQGTRKGTLTLTDSAANSPQTAPLQGVGSPAEETAASRRSVK
jgi:hypothetical protein